MLSAAMVGMNRLSLLVLSALITSKLVHGITYDAALDFSSAQNPAGVWSYGWLDSSGFHPFTASSEVAPGVKFWTGGDGPLGEPTVGKNESNFITAVSPTMYYEPGEFALHPGRRGEKAVLRWTNPDTGIYAIGAVFSGVDSVGTTTDVQVFHGGTELANGSINGHNSVEFTGTLTVNQGQYLDFRVGFGANETFWFDTTRLDVTISTVPDASGSLYLFAFSGITLLFVRRELTVIR